VLLPSFDTCHVYLAPNLARYARIRRGWSGRPELSEVALPEETRLETLARALGASRSPIRLTLSGQFAHVLLLPFQASLETAAEWEAYARHACVSIFGEKQGGWRIRLSRQGYGQPIIAAVVEENLYAAIETEMQKQERRLLSVEPFSADVFDRHRRMLGRDFWLFIAEASTCTCWYAQDGVIRNVLAHPLEADWRGSLGAFIARELAKKGDPNPAPIFLHTPEAVHFKDEELPGLTIRPLADVASKGLR
jgi:hypothetical protein